jgi:DNA processing protein
VNGAQSAQRLARAALTYLAEPADKAMGTLLGRCAPDVVVAAVKSGSMPAEAAFPPGERALMARALPHWRARLAEIPTGRDLAEFERAGIRLVCPGDPEWPTQLDALGDIRPYALWLRGSSDLRFTCLRSVSIVGARAATAYGSHVSAELSAGLASRGWAIVSGGAYGIDGAAHRGALAADGTTVAVLACGVDDPYPLGHSELFAAIAAQGVLASEWPPGRTPTRPRFLVRNRVIAALTRGTVVVEAGRRSGALNTGRHARELCRPLMAVPGPVTSEASAGCHWIMREWGATCVTGAADVLEQVAAVGEHLPPSASLVPAAELDELTARVLEAVPARGGMGPAAVAVAAGVDLDTTLSRLGLLAAAGLVARGPRGWRVAR